jgi:hypothetical protein
MLTGQIHRALRRIFAVGILATIHEDFEPTKQPKGRERSDSRIQVFFISG